MRRIIYLPHRAGVVASLFFLLFLLSVQYSMAQQKAAMDAGVLRIKVSEDLALQLERARITRNADNGVFTGIKSLDNVNQRYRVSGIKRVFRPAGKFEAKHRQYGLHRWYEIEMDKATPVLEALAAYKTLLQVEKAEPVYKKAIIGSGSPTYGPVIVAGNIVPTLPGVSNDPLVGSQWHYDNTGQTGGTPGSDISLFPAWGLETGTSNVIVAVTDGGIQVNHPDLVANMWINADEIPGNNLDDDNNGYIDDINGYGFGDNTGTIAPDQHGTHVGGTIAATTNNGIGVAGIAGGSGAGDGARLMSCAAFGANGTGGFAETYLYGADNGAVISQNSWGYTSPGVFEQAVLDAIDYFIAQAGKNEFGVQVGPMNGGIVVFAAGNDDSNAAHYPGFYSPTLSVSATTHQDKKAWYSNFGDWVDIAAPGGETAVAQQGVLSTLSNNQYGFFQGTSMACPHVSGVAALIVSRYGGAGFTPDMLRGRLVQTVDNIDAADPDFAGLLGSGRLNAFSALQQDDDTPPDAIADLAAADVTITGVTLAWTSPADAGNGSASSYDIRYSTSPITEENFGDADSVLNPPSPKPAGGAEEVSITGLLPGTTYYFAVKSADFFGNTSAISNVIAQATNFAPVISVVPLTLTADLLTAEITTKSFTIHNLGQGPLEFSMINMAPVNEQFATPSPTEGAVAAGDSAVIQVTFDAHNLGASAYNNSLWIFSNDPVNDTVQVSLNLNVTGNGFPIASVQQDTIDFGGVFQGGSKSYSVIIHNDGSEPLILSQVVSDEPSFTTNFTGSITINPFEDGVLEVTFSPTVVAPAYGAIFITTNDPANGTLVIAVQGEGLDAPGITVTPTSLSESLNTGNTSTQFLTVENTGASNLEIAVSVSTPATTLALTKQIELASPAGVSTSSATIKQSASGRYQQSSRSVTIKSVQKSAATSSVLILSPDDDVSDLAAILNAYDDVTATIFPKASLPGITLSDISGYDVVVTSNNTQWLASGSVDPSTIGDLLADYIDDGGKVIVNQFAYSYDAWQMTGRFIDEQYGPFTPSTTDANIDISLGTIFNPGHPVMQGVSMLDYSGYVQNVGLAPGATALAEWANGELFVAVNGNVVALNMLPSLGNGGPLQWAGDLPTLYQNAIHYLAGPSFVKVDPGEAVVAPGDQVSLEVTFNASGLDAGVFTASIDIESNVPGSELVAVPAVLTVLGPEFTVTPDSLNEELEKQQQVSRTIVLSNNGPSDYAYTVSVAGVGVSSVPVKTTAKVLSVAPAQARAPKSETGLTKGNSSNARQSVAKGKQALISTSRNVKAQGRSASVSPLANADLYSTDFESFDLGDIDGQQNWEGQFENWTVESVNPFSGQKHFSGLADGLGLSLAFSPVVPLPVEATSTTTMKLNIQGSGVTWEIIPQSVTAGLVNTRLEFGSDGIARALVDDGAGGFAYLDIPASVPTGYFDLTIEVSTDSAVFDVYFNNDKVFTGQGFAGVIEQVVILSWMEEAGPTLDIDNFKIIDGKNVVTPELPPFLSVSPVSGNLPSGATAEITVTFDAGDLDFGYYTSAVNIDILGAEKLVVPAFLRVVGDPAIVVNPTVIQTVVGYKEDTTQFITIQNTGGRPLAYDMQVIGASTDVAKLPPSPVNKFANWESDARIRQKRDLDVQKSKASVAKAATIELLAGTALLEEGFEGGNFPPSDWSVVDNAGTGVAWGFAADIGYGNFCGTGEAATVSSDFAGSAAFDTELITPTISTEGFKNIVVQYNVNYQNFLNLDFLDLDIQVEGSSTWENVLRWNEDHGTLLGAPGEFASVELDEFLGGATSFKLRWHYYDLDPTAWDWYAQIDDVVVLGDPRAWLSVSPSSGVIPVGGAVDVAANFDAEDVESGFYVAGILVRSNAPQNSLVGVVASMEVLNPAVISVTPDSLYQVLENGTSASQSIIISNSGESTLRYSIGNIPMPAGSGQVKERREPAHVRTDAMRGVVNLMETKAIAPPVSKAASLELYVTGFEEFAPGDIDEQEGWQGQWANWTIEGFNPFEGSQHFRGLSDGLGQSLAFSPVVVIGSDPISSTTMKLNLDNTPGATWQIIPQSPTAQLVNTRVQFAPDGSLSALVQDSLGNVSYQEIPFTAPSGYFDFRIDIERATARFTIYVDGDIIFAGQGFAGDIEQVVVLSLMEIFGPTFDLDNIVILDGPPQAPWLVLDTEGGNIPSNSSATVNVTFDASDLEEGTYQQLVNIISNDPLTPVVSVPVTLRVYMNHPPVLAVRDTFAIESESLSVVFTATDVDDSEVSVELLNAPSFISLTSTGNGEATYLIQPVLGDRGEYYLSVLATDARGKSDSATFHLTVKAYGVENFSLIDITTSNPILDFTDSVTLDVLDPSFARFGIAANTNPQEIGSVQFWVDGKKKNLDNDAPYLLSNGILAGLAKGPHVLKAESFTRNGARGARGQSITAVVNITNSSAVTRFETVTRSGVKLFDLVDGAVIKLKDAYYIRVSTTPAVTGSVQFFINGTRYSTDNAAPYSLAGDWQGTYSPWPAKVGHYTITATPYPKTYGQGIAGTPLTISFDIVDGTATTAALAKEATSITSEESGEVSLSVYPVPVTDDITIRLGGDVNGDVRVSIRTLHGQRFFLESGNADKFRNYRISTTKLGMSSGMYIVQLEGANGLRKMVKFVKNE